MSDLIERLQDVWDGKATFPTERLPEIIEQLKTLRGIEGLAKQEAIISFSKGRWCVETSRTPGGEFVGFYASTLPLAVEAAVKGMEGDGRRWKEMGDGKEHGMGNR